MRWRSAFGLVLGAVAATALAACLLGVLGQAHRSTSGQRDADAEAAFSEDLVRVASSLGPGSPTIEGTGIVVSPSGVVVTNNHVVDGATAIRVTDGAGSRSYDASVLGYDVGADIAVLKLRGASGLPWTDLGRFATEQTGDRVVALGAGRRYAAGRISGTGGSVVEYSELTGATHPLSGLLVTTAAVRPGFSGGPLVDLASSGARRVAGSIVGMDVAYSAQGAARGYAIPSAVVRRIAAAVLGGAHSAGVHVGSTASLGVRITPVTSIGAVVVAVPAGAALGAAGLEPGDVVDTVAGSRVASPTGLSAVLLRYAPGDRVRVGWLTPQGAAASATVRLSPGPPA